MSSTNSRLVHKASGNPFAHIPVHFHRQFRGMHLVNISESPYRLPAIILYALLRTITQYLPRAYPVNLHPSIVNPAHGNLPKLAISYVYRLDGVLQRSLGERYRRGMVRTPHHDVPRRVRASALLWIARLS